MLTMAHIARRRRFFGGGSTLALSLFFTSATAASGTVTDTEGTGNTLTFTRASVAKYWDADGVLQEAASGIARVGASNRKPVTNLLSYPEQFDNAVWTKTQVSVSSGQADPFGGTNAFKLVEAATTNVHRMGQNYAVTAGRVYTLSGYVKSDERSKLSITPLIGSAYVQYGYNFSTDVIALEGAFGGNPTYNSSGIASVDGATGWKRWWMTFTVNTSGTLTTLIGLNNGTSNNYAGDGSSGLYIFGAQLNEGGIEDYIGASNLLTNDKAFGTGWTATNTTITADSTVAPDGTSTADTFADNSATGASVVRLRQNVTVPSAGTYTCSVFAKAKQLNHIALGEVSFDTSNTSIFDLSAGTVSVDGHSGGSSITYWGNGWYLCSIQFTTSSSLSGIIQINVSDGDTVVDLDGTSDIYIWGAQLTKGSTLYPYVGMPQTGFTKQGYLAEAAATNLVTDSEDFSAAAWTINNTNSLTVTANQLAAPDGTTTADEIKITDTTAETHLISDSITISSATDYAISCFLKADEQRYVGINLFISSENFATVVYDLYGGTVAATDVGTTSGTVTASGIINCGNGWYRAWASLRVTGTAATIGLATYASASPTFDSSGLESYAGTANDAFHAWGMMVETGVYPSSYIKTSGGTATRAADTLRIADITGFYDELKGTLVSDVTNIVDGISAGVALMDNSNSNSYHIMAQSAGSASIRVSVRDGGTPDYATLTSGTIRSRLVRSKYAIAYSATDEAVATHVSGATQSASLSNVTMPVAGIDELAIYKAQAATAEAGYIKTVQYYSERKSDADLATLSTITDDGTSWRDEQAA